MNCYPLMKEKVLMKKIVLILKKWEKTLKTCCQIKKQAHRYMNTYLLNNYKTVKLQFKIIESGNSKTFM